MNDEVKLILLKLKIVSEEQEKGMYLCDKEHSKILLDYITNLQEENKALKHKINVVNREINNILWYNYDNDTTSGFGNAIREIKFYLSDCKTLEEFDKLQGNDKK